jgi:hypothetical protein
MTPTTDAATAAAPAKPAAAPLTAKVARLVAASLKRVPETFRPVDYPDALDTHRLIMPEAYVSLYHHPVYRTLTDEQKWRLGLLETVNFYSINIHGERALIVGLEERLYKNRVAWESNQVCEYLQHFVHEENAHTFMLAGYCNRYYGRVMPDLGLAFEQIRLSRIGDDLLFYGRLYVLEMWLAYLNGVAMLDTTLDETTRTVHHIHHQDEAKHLAFDKEVLHAATDEARARGLDEELRTVAAALAAYRTYALGRLYNPAVYRAIGIRDASRVAAEASGVAERRALEATWMAQCDAQLHKLGLRGSPPAAAGHGTGR